MGKLAPAGVVIKELRAAGANMSCKRLKQLMEMLGFEVERRGNSNHYVVSHPGLREFRGTNFACRHGRNPQVLPAYVHNMKQIIVDNESELDEINS